MVIKRRDPIRELEVQEGNDVLPKNMKQASARIKRRILYGP